MANELHKRKEQRRRRRWLAAGFIGLGLIAVGCRHHGVQELTTGEGASAETGRESSESGGGEGSESGGGEGSESGGEHGGEGSEGGGGEGSESGGGEGSESGGEHGAEGSEGGGEEERPTTPLDQIVSDNLNSLDYTAFYDPASNEFRGVVENNTSQTVCAARVEVHVATNGRVVELGPTAGVDLAPGETLAVVLLSDSISPDTYSFHAESSPCP